MKQEDNDDLLECNGCDKEFPLGKLGLYHGSENLYCKDCFDKKTPAEKKIMLKSPKTKKTSGPCCWDFCREKGFLDDIVEDYYCPIHYYTSLGVELDSVIRDCWPINWPLSKKQEQVIKFIRDTVREKILKSHGNYYLYRKVWEDKQKAKNQFREEFNKHYDKIKGRT